MAKQLKHKFGIVLNANTEESRWWDYECSACGSHVKAHRSDPADTFAKMDERFPCIGYRHSDRPTFKTPEGKAVIGGDAGLKDSSEVKAEK